MSNTFKKPNSQVSTWHPSTNEITPTQNQSIFAPNGLTLRQTITSSGSVTIPAGVTWVYVIMAGAGRGGFFGYGGRGGEVSWGWTLAQSTCIIGAGTTGIGGYTRYGHIIAKGGAEGTPPPNYYGMPAGQNFGDMSTTENGGVGANAGQGSGITSGNNADGGNGGDGISGGGGGNGNRSTGNVFGGNGGSGLVGGGGAGTRNSTTTDTRTGGNGGNGIGVDGTVYTGGTGSSQVNAGAAGGGGAGIAGNGTNASGNTAGAGGLGGGGGGSTQGGSNAAGGAGILYIYY